jgi:selenide,water dikinase
VNQPDNEKIKLTAFSHGGGCGCKIAPGVLSEILKNSGAFPAPAALLVGRETSDDPYDFGRIAATNAISDVYAMGGTPIMALALVGMPIAKLSNEVIGKILEGGESICAQAGIPIAGGHTIDSLEPIYGLVVLGLVHPDRVKKNSDAQAGDVLILGKPLGVGVLSAAVKKDQLDAAGYDELIACTTKLNTPGRRLAELPGVHALTDVTGFGLLGHLLELCRGASLTAQLDMDRIPLLSRAENLAAAGMVTGASGRNWASYGSEVDLSTSITPVQQALLTDPQTSGGLLVSCAPQAVDEVLEIFRQEGFAEASVIGQMAAGAARVAVA